MLWKIARKDRPEALTAEVWNDAKFLKYGLITERLAISSQIISARLCRFEYIQFCVCVYVCVCNASGILSLMGINCI